MAYRPSRRAIISTAVIATLLGAFILLLPEIIRRVAVSRLQDVFSVPVAIDDIDINLFTGRAAVENLVIGETPARRILSVPVMTLGFSRSALLTGRINLQRVSLQDPRLVVERTAADTYNITEAVRLPENMKGSEGGAKFAITRLEIHKGEIEFVDRTRNPDYEISFTSIDIAAGPISGLPERRIDPTNFTAGVRIAGGTVKVAGVTKPLAEPLDLELTAEVDDVELEKFSAYLPYGGRLDLQKTMIDGQARYVLAHRDGKLAQHGIDATLQIGGIGLATTQGYQQVMQLAGVEARDIHVDFLQNQAQIGALSLEEPYLLIQRDATGFNFEEFLPESENADVKKPPQNESNGAPMALVVQRAEAQGGTIDFIDQTVNPNANTRLHSLDIVAEKMTVWPNFAAGAMNAEGQTGKGSLSVSGAIHNQPLKGEFSIVGNELPFTPYRGYLNQLFSAARSSGNLLNGKVKLVFAPAKGGEMVTSISGRLEGHQMALRFGGQENPFLTTQQLGVGVKTLRLGLNPRVDIEEINFHGANLDVLRDQDGNINLRRLWASDSGKSPDSEAEVAKQGGAETTVAIRTIKVEKSAIEIVDQGVSPNYTTKVSQVSGKISNIVSSVERAELTLEGMLGDSAALKVSGWFTPFTEKPYLHLEGTVRRYELPPLNPYATEYVSHRIRQGDITTEVSYTIHGDKIRATAEIVLRDVRVGEKTGDEFVKRVGIPLDLAIALLQDIQGVVRLQLAMNGDGGPELNVGALIWDAVRNAVIRAITAPFRLVGRILTLGGRIGSIRIDPIRFQPGTREVESQSVKQLADLAELLKEKPRLEIRLNGQASPDEATAIKQEILLQNIEATGAKNYQEALVQLYREMTGMQLKAPLEPKVEESLEHDILQRIEVTDEELRELVRDRAETVKQQLAKHGVDRERLLVSTGEVVADGTPLVEIELVS